MTRVPTVLFVCLHGAAKSVVAAEQLRRIAAERGIVVEAGSAGVEPYDDVPPGVVAGLREEGLEVGGLRPSVVSTERLAAASHVVSFGCDLSAFGPPGRLAQQWTGVPDVSDGYDEARREIVARVEQLVESLLTPTAAPASDRAAPRAEPAASTPPAPPPGSPTRPR